MLNFLQEIFNKVAILVTVVVMTVTAPFHLVEPTQSPTPSSIIIASPSATFKPSPSSTKPIVKKSVQTVSPIPSQTPSNQSNNGCTQEEAQAYLKAHYPDGTKFDSSVQLACDRDKSVQNTKPLQDNIVALSNSPTPTPASNSVPTYKPCCTTASGEQVRLETVDCISYAFGGKSYDIGQAAQKIKDVTGLRLGGGSDTELNGSMIGNSVGITISLYKTDAYDYSNFRPDYPGLKVVYHYAPVACTDDLKQKINSVLDTYKSTLP